MPSIHGRKSSMFKSVNAHCANCNTQIGIYDNEWIRLTSSYVIPKAKGTQFGIDVADKSQTVTGKSHELVEGCVLSEAHCQNCSKSLGHYCRDAPGKQQLIGHYVFRLPKVYLKDARTFLPVQPEFTFGANFTKPNRAQSLIAAPGYSTSPFSGGPTIQRQSMGPPTSRVSFGIPASSTPHPSPCIDPDLQSQPQQTPGHDYSTPYNEPSPQPGYPTPYTETPYSASIQHTSLSQAGLREDPILRKLADHDATFQKVITSVNGLNVGIGRLLSSFKEAGLVHVAQPATINALGSFMYDLEKIIDEVDRPKSDNGEELRRLREENAIMKNKLNTIGSALGRDLMESTPAPTPKINGGANILNGDTPSLLGKRKRASTARSSLLQNEVFQDDDEGRDDRQASQPLTGLPRRYVEARERAATAVPEPANRLNTPFGKFGSNQPVRHYRPTESELWKKNKPTEPIIPVRPSQQPTPPDSATAYQKNRDSAGTDADDSLASQSRDQSQDQSRDQSLDRSNDNGPSPSCEVHDEEALTDAEADEESPETEAVETKKIAALNSMAEKDGDFEPVPDSDDQHTVRSPGPGASSAQKAGKQNHECEQNNEQTRSGQLQQHIEPDQNVEQDQRDDPAPRPASRTFRPCTNCRKRKMKCDLSQGPGLEKGPPCVACRKHKQQCIIPEALGRRSNSIRGQQDQDVFGLPLDPRLTDANKENQRPRESAAPEPQQPPPKPIVNVPQPARSWLDTTTAASGHTHPEFDDRYNPPRNYSEWRAAASVVPYPPIDDSDDFEELSFDMGDEGSGWGSAAGDAPRRYSKRLGQDRPKRPRRKPEEVKRHFKCLYPGCEKAYGTLPHLNKHMEDMVPSHGEKWFMDTYNKAAEEAALRGDDGFEKVAEEESRFEMDKAVAASAAVAEARRRMLVEREKKQRERDERVREAMEREKQEVMGLIGVEL